MAKKKAFSSHTETLQKKGLIQPPKWLVGNLMFEAFTGSEAYGCRQADSADIDIVGFTIPPKHTMFPHLAGYIPGFGKKPTGFDQFLGEQIEDKETKRLYDITIYGIVRFFQLTMENNPNMIDNLFVPRRCITKSSPIYEHLRDHRHLFLSTRVYHSFRGYANQQLAKMKRGTNRKNPKRAESIEKYGYDVKFGYHLVRLMLECEQILTTGDLVLDRDAKTYNNIRAGEWSMERLEEWFTTKEKTMEALYKDAVVPHSCDQDEIKKVLLECLEMHMGDLSDSVIERERDERILDDLEDIIYKYGRMRKKWESAGNV